MNQEATTTKTTTNKHHNPQAHIIIVCNTRNSRSTRVTSAFLQLFDPTFSMFQAQSCCSTNYRQDLGRFTFECHESVSQI